MSAPQNTDNKQTPPRAALLDQPAHDHPEAMRATWAVPLVATSRLTPLQSSRSPPPAFEVGALTGLSLDGEAEGQSLPTLLERRFDRLDTSETSAAELSPWGSAVGSPAAYDGALSRLGGEFLAPSWLSCGGPTPAVFAADSASMARAAAISSLRFMRPWW